MVVKEDLYSSGCSRTRMLMHFHELLSSLPETSYHNVRLHVDFSFFLLQAYGHENVSVLDGGLMNWKTAGQAMESGPMSLPEKVGLLVTFFIHFDMQPH